ncbi:MAG: hypothetical protein MK212_01255 [Saprospiraceae bacterium]|nr:hypothetical protein [Saprospiraceae bacterium]
MLIPGRTLTYYYYKIQRPYFIWGEEVIGGYQSNDAGDKIDTRYRARSITVN